MSAEFINILPKIASHPLAIVAYICLLTVWLLWFFRKSKSADFLSALELMPKEMRAEFARKAGYNFDELSSWPTKQAANG